MQTPPATSSADSIRTLFDTHKKSLIYTGRLDDTPTHRRELRCIERCLGDLPEGSRVLDLPCGTGRLLPYLNSRNFQIVAADSSTHMLERTRELVQRQGIEAVCTLSIEDVLGTSYESQSMDAVICNRLFHHFFESDTRVRALKELRRISRGPIVVSFFCSHSISSSLFLTRNTFRNAPRTDRVPIPLKTMMADVAAAGLVVKQSIAAKPLLGKQWYLELRTSSASGTRRQDAEGPHPSAASALIVITLCCLLESPLIASNLQAATESDMTARIDQLMSEIRADTRETRHYTGRAVLDERVMEAMRQVPRDQFVPPDSELYAWENRPLSIGYRQTISQPFIVALMTDQLNLQPDHRVLEIGTGSGYQAAVLSLLAAEVFSIEIVPELADQASKRLTALGYDNVSVRVGDGRHGWAEAAPYDRIVVTAVGEEIPPELLDQLKISGRMVMPIGPPHAGQNLTLIEKTSQGTTVKEILPVQFVPLTRAPE